MRRAWYAVAVGLFAGCTPAPTPPPSPAPVPTTAPAPAASPSQARAPSPPPPLENAAFITGAPRDETAFEFDVEVGDDGAPPELDGVPASSAAHIRRLQPFLETRRAKLSTMLPDAGGMLVLTRLGETTQVHHVAGPLGMRRQVTFGLEPVEQVGALQSDPRQLLYRADLGGDENYQIFHLDLARRITHMVTDGQSRHGAFRWSVEGRLAYTSNARNGRDMDLYVREPGRPSSQLVAELDGQWTLLSWAPSGEEVLMLEYLSATSSTLHLVNVTTGRSRPLLALEPGVIVRAAVYGPKGERLYVASSKGRDTVGAFEVDPSSGKWTALDTGSRWEVEELSLSRDGRRLAMLLNEEGSSSVRVRDLSGGTTRAVDGIPRGVVSGLRYVGKGNQLAFTHTSATRPPNAWTYDIDTGALVQWTDSETGGVVAGAFVAPTLVRVTSFDGLSIPAFLYRPRGEGPFPVLLWIHGGPEDQFRPRFDPIIQYFAATRGVAVLAPNIRGSDGYGIRYLGLDDGARRHHAIRDIGALLDLIAERPDLDADRVGIHGASYGGFMVLAALVAYPDRIRAGCDVVGISNFVTFLENTSEYRRDLRRAEYGDERLPEMREYLEDLSPLRHVERIRSALLVAHGENDPRVPLSEARQVVEGARANGVAVWSFVARSEGHSFRKRRNRDAFYRTMTDFFDRYLVRGEPVDAGANVVIDERENPLTQPERDEAGGGDPEAPLDAPAEE